MLIDIIDMEKRAYYDQNLRLLLDDAVKICSNAAQKFHNILLPHLINYTVISTTVL